MSGPLEPVIALCDEVAATAPAQASLRLASIAERLRQPLRVAVAGRVSAGKSTLVNALLGRPLAPTAAGECTRVVTLYRAGFPEGAELVLRDGGRRPVRLSGGALPQELAVDPDRVRLLSVTVSNDALLDLSVLDTPGLASLNEHHRATVEALREADALVYVMEGGARQDDADALAAFRAQTAGARVSALNVLAVLNKVDLLDPEGDPLATGARLARRLAGRLGHHAAAVAPLIGLLAESCDAGRLTEDHARELRALATCGVDRERLLWSFADEGLPVGLPHGRRRELLRLLGPYGLRRALELVDSGAGGLASIGEGLRTASGIDGLRDLIDTTLRHRSQLLKADAGLSELARLGAELSSHPALARVPERCRRLRRELGLEAAHLVGEADRVGLPEHLREDLRRLAAGPTPAQRLGLPEPADPRELGDAVIATVCRWRQFANGGAASAAQARLAEAAVDAFTDLWDGVAETAAAR